MSVPRSPRQLPADLTLRDYFAAAVLHDGIHHSACQVFFAPDMQLLAQRCYMLADALLAERDKPVGQALQVALSHEDAAAQRTVDRLSHSEWRRSRP